MPRERGRGRERGMGRERRAQHKVTKGRVQDMHAYRTRMYTTEQECAQDRGWYLATLELIAGPAPSVKDTPGFGL